MNFALPREPPPKAGGGTGAPGAGATDRRGSATPATGEALSRTVGLMRGSVHIRTMDGDDPRNFTCDWCGLNDKAAPLHFVGGGQQERATRVHWGCLKSMIRILRA